MRAWSSVVALGMGLGCAAGGAPGENPLLGAADTGSTGAADEATAAADSGDRSLPPPGPPGSGEGSSGTPVVGCGDGELDVGEECDDGNRINADGCNADCRVSGALVWDDTFGSGFGFIEDGMSVAAAPDGTVFVAGFAAEADGARDAWIRRYGASGEPLWTQTVGGVAGGSDEARSVLLDEAGGLYVGGYQSTMATGLDAWLRSYTLQGDEVWSRGYDGPASGTDVFQGMTIDGAGNLVVAGYHTDAGDAGDVLLQKYSPGGDVLWTRTYAAGNGGNDLIWDVKTSAAGHLYAAGYETGIAGEGINAWLAKYDTDGNAIWSRTYNGAASLDDYFIGVEVIGEDDVVVCGYETAVEYPWHAFVRRYDSLGMIVWTDEYEGAAGEGAHCFGVAADSEDNLVTTGGELVAGVRGVMLRKYDADGAVRWSRTIAGGDVGPDFGRRVAVGPDDTIVATGSLNSGADDRDVWVGVFTP